MSVSSAPGVGIIPNEDLTNAIRTRLMEEKIFSERHANGVFATSLQDPEGHIQLLVPDSLVSTLPSPCSDTSVPVREVAIAAPVEGFVAFSGKKLDHILLVVSSHRRP